MKELNQKYYIKASPEEVYYAITNPLAIELWSGYKAEMSDKEGEEFSLWEGDITGINLEMLPFTKIVQEWYFGDQEEKSIVTIQLTDNGKQTFVKLHQSNIPDEVFKEIEMGWKDYYWSAVKEYFK